MYITNQVNITQQLFISNGDMPHTCGDFCHSDVQEETNEKALSQLALFALVAETNHDSYNYQTFCNIALVPCGHAALPRKCKASNNNDQHKIS